MRRMRTAAKTRIPEGEPLLKPVLALLRRFRAQQPIRVGSLLVTIFGDAIAPRGGAVTLGSLIALAAPFGITERHVRTAVGRLAQDGWFIARRAGRRSEYHLTAHGAERFHEATQRIYGHSPVTWDRQWTQLLLPARGDRPDGLYEQLRWLGFGRIDSGLFIHPNPQLVHEPQWLRELNVPGALLMASRTADPAIDLQLASAGWDLQQLAAGYRRFMSSFQPLGSLSAAAMSALDCFIVRTLLIHEYRKIHLQDPLLPPTLLPGDWVGAAAYELCASLYADVFARSEAFLSDTAATFNDTLPAPGPAAQARFGGLALSPSDPAGAARKSAGTGWRADRP
jgi:phenylacetic acid degradation operon negative regulatory protein